MPSSLCYPRGGTCSLKHVSPTPGERAPGGGGPGIASLRCLAATHSQPYFPSWQNNLVFPEPEIREGTFIFRVSLADVWRLIAMPATATLDDLVLWILRSVKFDDEHLYQLTYRNRMGSTVSVRHPACEESPYTDEVIIGELPLEPGQTMELLYDFGDEWHFTVKLERIEPPGDKLRAPRILESHGKAPKQYRGLGRVNCDLAPPGKRGLVADGHTVLWRAQTATDLDVLAARPS